MNGSLVQRTKQIAMASLIIDEGKICQKLNIQKFEILTLDYIASYNHTHVAWAKKSFIYS